MFVVIIILIGVLAIIAWNITPGSPPLPQEESECKHSEDSILIIIGKLDEALLNLNIDNFDNKKLDSIRLGFALLEVAIKENLICPNQKKWQKNAANFIKHAHKKVADLITEWNREAKENDEKQNARYLLYEKIVLTLSINLKNLCAKTNEICDEKINDAFERVLFAFKNKK